jgi:hypothetical protein
MYSIIADASSYEYNTLDPATNPERFRLGPPLSPSSPTGAPHHPPSRLNVISSKQQRTTVQEATSENNGNAGSSIILPLSIPTATSFLTTKMILMMTSFPCQQD